MLVDRETRVSGRAISRGAAPFVIAEMSGNHNQSLERALAIVEAAAKSGAHALKIQTYTADTMTLDLEEGEFFISDPKSLWEGKSLHKLYQEAYTPWEWHKPIFDRARELGMVAFSTPFDETAVEFLEELDVPCYKIASFENTDIPLIRKVAATGKPMILSTGMATVAELAESVDAAREAGCRELILLKCTSTYPATPENTNILTIPHMRELFGCEVGLSDHTMGIGVAVASVALGATVIEKHFTLDRSLPGPDHAASLTPSELRDLVQAVREVEQAVGRGEKRPVAGEAANRASGRKSLVAARPVRRGEVFTQENLTLKRPGTGIPATEYYDWLGRAATRDYEEDEAIEP